MSEVVVQRNKNVVKNHKGVVNGDEYTGCVEKHWVAGDVDQSRRFSCTQVVNENHVTQNQPNGKIKQKSGCLY